VTPLNYPLIIKYKKLKLVFSGLVQGSALSNNLPIRCVYPELMIRSTTIITTEKKWSYSLHFLAVGSFVTANSELEDNSPKLLVDYKI